MKISKFRKIFEKIEILKFSFFIDFFIGKLFGLEKLFFEKLFFQSKFFSIKIFSTKIFENVSKKYFWCIFKLLFLAILRAVFFLRKGSG